MPINLKVLSESYEDNIDPKDIFDTLVSRDKKYTHLRDVQSTVLSKWFARKDEANNVIKMSTGGGKTVVGLLILKSCLNEKKGPAVYVVPNKYLVNQVCEEAKALGIPVVGEIQYEFSEGKAILVTNIQKLVNGKSVFGMNRDAASNKRIGSIVIDDAHACIEKIEEQHTLDIENSEEIYKKIIELVIENMSEAESMAFDDSDSNERRLLPFWIWKRVRDEVKSLIKNCDGCSEKLKTDISFKMPFLRDNWNTANCMISRNRIEITIKGTRLDKITGFSQAERRIFMSATLSDDSVLVTTFGCDNIQNNPVIAPNSACDMGARIILAPGYRNQAIKDDCIRESVKRQATKHRVIVIVPSFERAELWGVDSENILSSRDNNIEKGIKALRDNPSPGITVLVNRYDGIDLPDDSCRILVLDGMPPVTSDYERKMQDAAPEKRDIQRKAMQKIEQGMGRGIRSKLDFCAVILMGNDVIKYLMNSKDKEFFSQATLKQYSFSNELLVGEVTLKDIEELISCLLNNKQEIRENIIKMTSSVNYLGQISIEEQALKEREAFIAECSNDYITAFDKIQEVMNSELDIKSKGVYTYWMAEYKQFFDYEGSLQLAMKAHEQSFVLPKMSIQSRNLSNGDSGYRQAERALQYKNGFRNIQGYRSAIEESLRELQFCRDKKLAEKKRKIETNGFEKALNEVGRIVGLVASRPELDEEGGPDNLLCLENELYAVIECKSGVKADIQEISKKDCAQLLNSVEWFKRHYPEANYFPILIHRTNEFSKEANPGDDFRVMTEQKVAELREHLKEFLESGLHRKINNKEEMFKLLGDYRLLGRDWIKEYTVEIIKRNRGK